PGAARAHGRGLLPLRPRVLATLRPRRRPRRFAAGPHDRHAPRPDGPRHGDRVRRRGRPALDDRRPGRQRRQRADGRPLPAARRRRAGHRRERRSAVSYVLKSVLLYGEGDPVDVLLADGVIAEIGTGLTGDEEVDGAGCVLLPGLVDLHTHLREPGREDAETVASGTLAAALGGFTA